MLPAILRSIYITLLFLVIIGFVFFPFLSGNNIIRGVQDDYTVYATMGFFKHFGDSLRQANQFALWAPQVYAGFPVWLTQIGFFNPLGIFLFRFLDYITAYNWLTYLNFVFAGLAAYWLARNLNLSTKSSLVAGFVYSLSQLNFYWGGLIAFSNGYLFLPLLFIEILKLSQGQYYYILPTALTIAFGIVAGETQVAVYALAAGLAWWLFLNWQDIKQISKSKFQISNLKTFSFILAIVLSGILASFWVIPVFNYLPYTSRIGGASALANLNFNFKLGDPIRYFYPFIELPTSFIGDFFSKVANFYIAVLALILAILAILFWRKNKIVSFFFWLFLLTYLVRVKFIPLAWLMNFVPVLNRFRTMFHWHSISVFALSMLSAFGLEYLSQIKEHPRFGTFVKGLKIFAVFNAAVVLTINIFIIFQSKILSFLLNYFDQYVYNPDKKFSLDYYHNIITEVVSRTFYSISLANPRFFWPFILILISSALVIFYHKGRISFDSFKTLAVVIIILNLILVFGGYYGISSRNLIENPPDTVKFFQNAQKTSNPFRVARFYPSDMYQAFEILTVKDIDDYNFKTLAADIGLYFNVDTITGHDPFVPRELLKILGRTGTAAGTGSLTEIAWLNDPNVSLQNKIERFSSFENRKLLGFLNVKYVLSSFEFPRPWEKVFETTATERKIPIYVYENPEFIGRFYLIGTNSTADKKGRVFIEKLKPQYVRIKINSPKNGALVFSEMNLPTWQAFIDGKQANIATYKDLFMSLAVPAGEHIVEFQYPSLWQQFKLAAARLL